MQAVLASDVSHGVLNLNADGSFDYTPALNFSGADSFTYRATDGLLESNLATVTIVVQAPPSAVDDSYSVDEDVTLVVSAATGVLLNDMDNNPPDDLVAVLVADATHGTLTDFSTDGGFTYLPDANFFGTDTFTYEVVENATGAKDQATVTLNVNSVNDSPVAIDDSFSAQPNTPTVIDVDQVLLFNDTDADGDVLSLAGFSQPANGDLVDNDNGTLTYTPPAGFIGVDTFDYKSTDGQAESNSATVTVLVDDENSPPQIISGSISFTKKVIDDSVDETHFVVAADFTGDSEIDVVATDFVDDQVLWYRNDGNGGFIREILDGSLDGAYPAHVADVDSDGDIDVLAGGYNADAYGWYQNNGVGGFTAITIDAAANGAHSVVAGDLDQDGDIDILVANQDAGQVVWYENDGNENFSWHPIDSSATGAKRADFADIDDDGDIDVLSASFFTDEIAWYENDGSQNFLKHSIDTTANGAYFVSTVDLDGDGDIDVASASQLDNTIAWYENDGNGSFTPHTLDTSANGARTVIPSDIDGDGDFDLLAASVNDDTIAWHRNDGNGIFIKQAIDLAADGAYGVFAIDMDRDGDVDVLSAGRDDNIVAVHYHVKSHVVAVEIGGMLTIDSEVLLTIDADDGPENLTYTLTAGPDAGELRLDGALVAVGGTFTQADVDAGRLAYMHTGVDLTADSFALTVADGGENGVQPAGGAFQINITGPNGDIITHLPLDEGSGTAAVDASGAGNDGMLVNGPQYEAATADGSAYSLRFDGADDFVDLGTLDAAGSGLTLAAWFNADSFPGPSSDPRIISKASGASANEHIFMLSTIQVDGAIRLRARVRIGGTTSTLIASTGDLTPGVWRHAALTYDNVTIRLYLDGIEVGSAIVSGAVDTASSVGVAVGAQPPGAGSRFFDGLIDDVRIAQRALSALEIADIVAGTE